MSHASDFFERELVKTRFSERFVIGSCYDSITIIPSIHVYFGKGNMSPFITIEWLFWDIDIKLKMPKYKSVPKQKGAQQ